MPANEAEIVELADRIIRLGFATRDEAVREIVDVIGHNDPTDELRADATAAVDRALVAHDHEERMWGTTDNDRLDRAALELEANGVLFRQNFACCQNCGFTRMADEVRRAQDNGQVVRGFIFFHWNDTEQVIDSKLLGLSYRALPNDDLRQHEAATLAVAAEAVLAIRREGLSPRWSGLVQDRITIPMTWQRRRFTAPPE